jgi:hypothetical protein
LSGKLPTVPVSASLIHLSVSYNSLTGSIPLYIQTHDFDVLDLSNNRFDGTLINSFRISSFQTTLQLSVNRLSGKLPDSITNMVSSSSSGNGSIVVYSSSSLRTLEVLASNIFSCNNEDLPSLDPYAHSYSCGSYDLNIASYLWLFSAGIVMISLVILSMGYFHRRNLSTDTSASKSSSISSWVQASVVFAYKTVSNVRLWWQHANAVFDSQGTSLSYEEVSARNEIRAFLTVLRVIKFFAAVLGIVAILVLLPIYVALHIQHSIVSYDYGFIVSVAFLHGSPPVILESVAIALILLFSVFVLTVLLSILRPWFKDSRGFILIPGKRNPSKNTLSVLLSSAASWVTSSSSREQDIKPLRYYLVKYACIAIFHAINWLVTITVNASYVNTILNPDFNRTELLFVQGGIAIFKFTWSVTYIPLCTIILETYLSHARNMQSRILMLLVNFILAPCIATLIVNQSCFYYVFNPSPAVTSYTVVSECGLFHVCGDTICCLSSFDVAFATTSRPSFNYSYACGTALLVAYAPVLLYSYIFYGLILQVIRFLLIYNHSYLQSLIQRLTRSSLNYPFIRGRDIIVRLMLHMTVLLTFGFAIPILGFTIVVGVVLDCLLSKLIIGRTIEANSNRSTSSSCLSEHHRRGISLAMLTSNPMSILTKNQDLSSHSTISEQLGRSSISDAPKLPRDRESSPLLIQYSGLDVYDSWYGLYVCFPYLAIVTSSFWALLFFDMIADIPSYGVELGMLTTLCYGIIVPSLVLGSYYLVFPRSGSRDWIKAPSTNPPRASSSSTAEIFTRNRGQTEAFVSRLFQLDSMMDVKKNHAERMIQSSIGIMHSQASDHSFATNALPPVSELHDEEKHNQQL